MNLFLPFLALLLSPAAPDEPVPASQPAASAPAQVVTTQQARGDLDWSLPKLEYRVQPGPRSMLGWSSRIELAIPPGLLPPRQYKSRFYTDLLAGRMEEIHETDAASHFSEAQRALLNSILERGEGWMVTFGSQLGRGFCVVYLPAATEEDARWMAQAFLEAANVRQLRRRTDAYRKLAEFREEGRKIEALLVGAQEEAMAAADAAEAARKRHGYAYSDEDQVRRDLTELQRSARLADVEVRGIQAKLSAIAAKARPQAAQLEADVLKRLQLEQDIELAGVLARLEAIRGQLADAKEVLDLSLVAKEKRSAADQLSTGRQESARRIADLEHKLSEPDPEYAPVKVASNEVVIEKAPKE